jgi:hypothetical protein
MSELHIYMFEILGFPIFVLTVGLAYFIRALVIKFERNNKIPPLK